MSLYAAAMTGHSAETIVERLELMCKHKVPKQITKLVAEDTKGYGQVSLVARKGAMYIESGSTEALIKLVENPDIQEARVRESAPAPASASATNGGGAAAVAAMGVTKRLNVPVHIDGVTSSGKSGGVKKATLSDQELAAAVEKLEEEADAVPEDLRNLMDTLDNEDEGEDVSSDVVSFKLKDTAAAVESVQLACHQMDYPLLSEYDFRADKEIGDIDMALKSTTVLRPFQAKSLRRMFAKGRARSGIIVLPCGAGKTLTGVASACTIGKRTLILCTSHLAVEQWKAEFLRWANIDPKRIVRFSSKSKDIPTRSDSIVIATYTILSSAFQRISKGIQNLGSQATSTAKMANFVKERVWGLIVMDEVQVAPANTFRKIMNSIKVHCKLGLTATLVREDGKINDLAYLIGPKLYEANWMDLQAEGHIAKVECNEVRVKMHKDFFKWYLSDYVNSGMNAGQITHLRNRLFCMNPNKFQAMEYLIRVHEARKDKIIVFSDDTYALKTFADMLYPNPSKNPDKQCYIRGDTPTLDREKILRRYRENPNFKTIFVSKIADNSIDLPDACVLIQISSHGAGRRQEAQRLGRILRRKAGTVIGEVNAFFYSIVSVDTKDLAYNKGRQRYLVDQGYSYQVKELGTNVAGSQPSTFQRGFEAFAKDRPFFYTKPEEVKDLLTNVLHSKFKDLDDDQETSDNEDEGAADKAAASSGRGGGSGKGGGGGGGAAAAGGGTARRQVRASAYSGGEGMVYEELNF